jgi:hypothetical protein
LPLVPLLTEGPDEFDVVIPSLPGIGYSELPRSGPLTRSRIAGLWAGLISELGYDSFGAFGADVGTAGAARSGPPRLLQASASLTGVPQDGRDDDVPDRSRQLVAGPFEHEQLRIRDLAG